MKIKGIFNEEIVFDDMSTLFSNHAQDSCEWHYLDFGALGEYSFVSIIAGKPIDIFKVEFDFSKGVPFKKVEELGILLYDVDGNKFLVCGHGSNNGNYGTNIDLCYSDADGNRVYTYDVTECQSIDWC